MFDVGFSELLIVGLVALLVLGPKRLPEVASTAGRWLGRLRAFMADAKRDLDREIQQANIPEWQQLTGELDDARRLMDETSAQLSHDLASAVPNASDIGVPSIAPPAAEPAAVEAVAAEESAAAVPKKAKARRKTAVRKPKAVTKKKSVQAPEVADAEPEVKPEIKE
ncbi:MAG: twin-arginine translocase subunit TatB [Gammaproteobacteria bacterium]|nr:twin-arginine translocase subunit TatB [Gammaproteobacteria bacterium]